MALLDQPKADNQIIIFIPHMVFSIWAGGFERVKFSIMPPEKIARSRGRVTHV